MNVTGRPESGGWAWSAGLEAQDMTGKDACPTWQNLETLERGLPSAPRCGPLKVLAFIWEDLSTQAVTWDG